MYISFLDAIIIRRMVEKHREDFIAAYTNRGGYTQEKAEILTDTLATEHVASQQSNPADPMGG